MRPIARFHQVVLLSAMAAVFGGLPSAADGQTAATVNRLSAEFRNFDLTETSTGLGVPGISIYTKGVFVPSMPSENNVIYVTLSATGDTEGGAAAWFHCMVDGLPCNPGKGGGAGAPGGWVALQREPSQLRDNGIHYMWCMKTSPGTHTVQIRMASSDPPNLVAIETAHFYIESNRMVQTDTGCNPGTP